MLPENGGVNAVNRILLGTLLGPPKPRKKINTVNGLAAGEVGGVLILGHSQIAGFLLYEALFPRQNPPKRHFLASPGPKAQAQRTASYGICGAQRKTKRWGPIFKTQGAKAQPRALKYNPLLLKDFLTHQVYYRVTVTC